MYDYYSFIYLSPNTLTNVKVDGVSQTPTTSGNYLRIQKGYMESPTTCEISADGYATQIVTLADEQDVYVTMQSLQISKISDGTNTYVIKDSEARTTLSGKQDTLVSGTNIKTVNNTSLLGSGNVSVGTVTSVNSVSPVNGNVTLSIPAAQVNSDWNAVSGVTQILNKPNLATVATSGSYNDLSNKPTIPSEVTESTVSGWGFTKNTGTVTSVNNVSPTNGNVSLSIPTVNNATLTITQGGTTKGTFTANASSNVTIDLDSGGSVDVDNKSITTNSSDQIQTVGVINSRDSSTAIKTWTGTKAQYDAITTKDSSTLYNITDDTDVSLTILEALYPVGSVYITTANTCPLSTLISGSTWSLRSSGVVTNVNTNVPVKGTGKALGLKSGQGEGSLAHIANFWLGAATNQNQSVGTSVQDTLSWTPGTIGGVTTDATKSGIVGTVTRSTLSVNIFERTA